ncbi:MAG: TfpX/TfpZ family type IV pilin accessory protein [Pseudomonadota bacterium]
MIDKLTVMHRISASLSARMRAAAIHLALSAFVAGLSAILVFWLWYPTPYRDISGGRELFILVISVDLVLGPLLTFAVFDLRKGWSHLSKDLAIIVAFQMAGLAYGIYTTIQARPIALVFEVDRYRVVTAAMVDHQELHAAPPEFRTLPLTGPWLLGTRKSEPEEVLRSVELASQGIDISQRPSYWRPYDQSRQDVAAKARPASQLLKQYPDARDEITAEIHRQGLEIHSAFFLPLVARTQGWSVLLNQRGDVVGFLRYDGFF